MSLNKKTIPGVFIIESLELENESDKFFEGEVLANVLNLSQVPCEYFYIRTYTEFIKIIQLFEQRRFRYLHISCHGGNNSIWTTFEEISNEGLGLALKGVLADKRLFLSACSSVNIHLAKEVISNSNCYSVIGPKNDIEFRDAAIMWASFYHLMFKKDSKLMLREDLLANLQKVVDIFEQPMNYFSRSASKGIKYTLVAPVNRRWTTRRESDIVK